VEEISVTEEDEYFPPPRNIRELQAAVGSAIGAMTGAGTGASTTVDDRALAASTVLKAL
jgi:4-hydroxy-3-methylbut-2-enyl diphosphate reductase